MQPDVELRLRHWFGDGESLDMIAAGHFQNRALGIGLYAVGRRAEAETMHQRDKRLNDRAGLLRTGQAGNQRRRQG